MNTPRRHAPKTVQLMPHGAQFYRL
jgi:hypothetical protein